MAQQTIADTIVELAHNVRKLGFLYMTKGRLKVTEKLAILLSTAALWAVVALLGLVCLVFVSIGIGQLLATVLAPYLAYLIVAAFYLLVLIAVVAFRRRIFTDPAARFMSRLIVEKPDEEPTDCDSPDDNTQTNHDDYDTNTSRP